MVPRSVERVYEIIDASPEGTEWHVTLTYVELYNDGFRDLLALSSQPGLKLLPVQQTEVRREQSAITMRETKGAHGAPPTSYLTGSSTFRTTVESKEQLLQLLSRGNAARAVGTTSLNERSSRSHAVITLNLESRVVGREGREVCVMTLASFGLARHAAERAARKFARDRTAAPSRGGNCATEYCTVCRIPYTLYSTVLV